METLGQKQRRFTRMIGMLIEFAYAQGFELSFGDCYRSDSCSHGHPRSLHRKRLAVDFNLFRNGVYLRSTESHRLLGEYWESIGGTWGGRFGDGNHYSLEHGGMK